MKDLNQTDIMKPGSSSLGGIAFAVFLSIFIFGSYFFHLIRQQWLVMVQKQSALEAIKVLAVPGSGYLNSIGTADMFKSAFFYLGILGMLFMVFLLFSLLLASPWKRGVFLIVGLFIIIMLSFHDRINISFPVVVFLSFSSFYLLTLSSGIHLNMKEIITMLCLIVIISISLFYGGKKNFFIKARDKVLFDSAPGRHVVSYYYTHSPLATSLISREKGIYEGLILHEGIKMDKPVYLGNGIFLTNDKAVKGRADYVITNKKGRILMTNRYGRTVILQSIEGQEIDRAIKDLFSMKGFFLLSRIGLYFFPAGLFILCLLGLKWLTRNKKAFFLSSAGLAFILVLCILRISVTGDHPPKTVDPKHVDLSKDGLSIAYYLREKDDIPETYVPVVHAMARSESTVLRYWGAYLLGILGDRKFSGTLMTLLEDPSPNIRYTAGRSLYSVMKNESLNPLLVRLLADPNWYVRCKIFSVFLKTGIMPSRL